jgi:hypothetical protein
VRKRYGRWYARRGRGAAHLGVFGTEAEAAAAHKAAEVSAAGLDPNSDLLQLPAELPKHDKRRYLFHGKSIAEWGRITGIPHPTLYWRMRVRNWPLELAIKANTTK